MLSNLSIEDEEYLHDLIDEIIHVEGRWDTNERRILFKETDIPLFAHHVREYFAVSLWSGKLPCLNMNEDDYKR